MTWAKGDAIQTGLASVQARRLLTAFKEVRLADAPEPEAIAAALADLVSSFVACWPDAARGPGRFSERLQGRSSRAASKTRS